MMRFSCVRGGGLVVMLVAVASAVVARADDAATSVRNTQEETTPLLSPAEALKRITVPAGFRVSLFAGEPQVRQPIGLTTDARGRVWVAENDTYAEAAVNFDLSQHDRIVILEDADHDGTAERRKVFWDQGQRLTSVELGFGGVWALCPPNLLFIPDRDGDDVPDGPPQVVLDGWNIDQIRHNIANGLRWGPDGWLYGRQGIQATSFVGAPGTPHDQRTALNCSVWRYHPTRKLFEVVCRGTTNSWGMDWNLHGELFFINTVIGHLWHAVPGAHFERMYGEDFDPHLYRLIGQTADHYHWDTAEHWSGIRKTGVTPTTDRAGGGHAHSGMMIYLGDNWPDPYRGTLFTVNLHGRRLNNDTLERKGAGYVGRHSQDFLHSTDPWFRALELIGGPDGGVYLADWSDIGECHENDGIHRSSGRIYKIVHATPSPIEAADLTRLSDAELVKLQHHKNEWYVRQSRQVLQQRAAEGRSMTGVHEALRALFEDQPDALLQLRALWALHVTGAAPEEWLLKQLDHHNEHIRAWVVRLLVDGQAPSKAVVERLQRHVGGERSGLVLLYVASALQKMAPAERWGVAEALAARDEFAADPMLPLMVWYGIEPAVVEDPARAVRLAGSSAMLLVSRLTARRLTEDLEHAPGPVDRLVAQVGQAGSAERSRALLEGMAEALRGWRKAPVPPAWESVRTRLGASSDEATRRLVQELSVVFGDGRALDEVMRVAAQDSADVAARREALRVLVAARADGTVPLLRGLLAHRDLAADAARGLAAFDVPEMPRTLLRAYPRLSPAARAETIIALSARPAYARALLEAVAAGRIDRKQVPAFQVRQMRGFPDEIVRRRVAELWPELPDIPAAKRERIARLKTQLDSASLASADRSHGRRLFVQACATCHTLFGQGGKIGPDLTGSQRSNLDYLLENLVDPAAQVGTDYRMSTVALADGRLLSGIVGDRSGPVLTIQTPTERLSVKQTDVEAIRPSNLSLMPEGLLDPLGEKDLRDLVGYLMSPQQVPLAEADPKK
jgi:putative membrane-bound dehydrogenase-like protein